MTLRQRRAHRLIWLALAVLIPVGLIAALRARPASPDPGAAHRTPTAKRGVT